MIPAKVVCSALTITIVAARGPAYAQIMWPIDDVGHPEMHDEFKELRTTLGPHWVMFSKTIDETVHWDEQDIFGVWSFRAGRVAGIQDTTESLNYRTCYLKFHVLSAYGKYGFGFNPITGGKEEFGTWVSKSGTIVNQARSHLRLEILDIAVPTPEYAQRFSDYCQRKTAENSPRLTQRPWTLRDVTEGGGALPYDKIVIKWLPSNSLKDMVSTQSRPIKP